MNLHNRVSARQRLNEPAKFQHETGFYHGASAIIGEMLLFREVDKPRKIKQP